MLDFSNSWQRGCCEFEETTRTTCYIKTNLRGKQYLRPPLKALQVVSVSDISKPRVKEAILFARWAQAAHLLFDSKRGTYGDTCTASSSQKKNNQNTKNATDATVSNHSHSVPFFIIWQLVASKLSWTKGRFTKIFLQLPSGLMLHVDFGSGTGQSCLKLMSSFQKFYWVYWVMTIVVHCVTVAVPGNVCIPE